MDQWIHQGMFVEGDTGAMMIEGQGAADVVMNENESSGNGSLTPYWKHVPEVDALFLV